MKNTEAGCKSATKKAGQVVMSKSLAQIYIHLIFSTKHRLKLIFPEIKNDIEAYLSGILMNMDCSCIEINAQEDHIHILFRMSRTISLSKIAEETKKSSSKWIKTQRNELHDFGWQNGYGAFSVNQSQLKIVKDYISLQNEHHCNFSFKEEFKFFLDKHEIEYDERYLWD
jgi:REP-associated tyrosine transposase